MSQGDRPIVGYCNQELKKDAFEIGLNVCQVS